MLSTCSRVSPTFSLIRYFAERPKVNWQSPDLYERLGVESNATFDEIKKKYHELVRAYHPDLITDPKEKEEGQKIISAVNEAYDTLKDEKKRHDYDMGTNEGSAFDFTQMHQTVYRTTVRLSFIEAALGCNHEITIDVEDPCPKCHGRCTDDGKFPPVCPKCNGQGITFDGIMPSFCRRCGGRGFVVPNPCKDCKGEGKMHRPEKFQVTLPPGIGDKSLVDLQTKFGIVSVLFIVDEDPLLKRDGMDLHVTVPISIKTAMIGGTVKVPTLSGVVEKKVLPGTQPYDVEEMPGYGVAGQGSLYIHYKVIIPRSLSWSEKKKIKGISDKFMFSTNDTWNSYLSSFTKKLNEKKG